VEVFEPYPKDDSLSDNSPYSRSKSPIIENKGGIAFEIPTGSRRPSPDKQESNFEEAEDLDNYISNYGREFVKRSAREKRSQSKSPKMPQNDLVDINF
jgi:hypothetical protein